MSSTVEQVIYRKLAANVSVANLVGTHLYNNVAVEGISEYIVIDVEREQDASIDDACAKTYLVTITAVSSSPSTRDTLRDDIMTSLNRVTFTDDNITVHRSNNESIMESSYSTGD